MATQTDIPDVSDDKRALAFQSLDPYLNNTILFAFLHGIYTGMVAVTLSKIFSRGRGVGINVMTLVVIVLYVLTATNFAFSWSTKVYSFIRHGQNFWTVYMTYDSSESVLSKLVRVGPGISGCISTVIADSAMIWRCWIVWGRRWRVILLPLVFMVLGTAFKILQIRVVLQVTKPVINYNTCTTIYVSLTLATTLLCTLLIVYRILSIEWAKPKLVGTRSYNLGAYRNVIEVVVESAALYSAALIVYIVVIFQDGTVLDYIDTIAGFIRAIAPTLLVGRVASGHSRPDDSWGGSAISSLHFGAGGHTQTGTDSRTEDLTVHNNNFVHDVEAQTLAGQPDEERVKVYQRVEANTVAD